MFYLYKDGKKGCEKLSNVMNYTVKIAKIENEHTELIYNIS